MPTEKKDVVWFWDDGYGDGKGVNGKGSGEEFNPEKDGEWQRLIKRGELLIPYHVAPWRKPKKRSEEEKVDPLSHITVIEEDGTRWLVGKGAIDQDSTGKWDGSENKHIGYKFRVFLKAFLGLMSDETQKVVNVLGMALPVDYEEDEARHEMLKEKILNQWHKCTIILANGVELEREVNVQELLIRKQAECALYDQYLDSDGNIIDKSFPRQFNVVADIGAGTLNVYTLNNLTPVDDLCFQSNDGMFGADGAYQLIREELESLRGGPVPDIQIPGIISAGTFLNAENQEVSITQIVNSKYEIHTAKVIGVLNTRLKNWWTRIYRVIWVGGGAEQERAYIQALMGNRVTQIFGDRFSNARGGQKIVQVYMKAKKLGKIKAKIGSQETAV